MRVRSFLGAALAALLAGAGAAPAPASPVSRTPDPICLQPRGANVAAPLLVEFYRELPEPREDDDPQVWAARMEKALDAFRKKVRGRYTEGTLLHLLDSPDDTARRAAVIALGMVGTMRANEGVAGRLHDDDPALRHLAADALWAIWFRGDSAENARELQKLVRQRDADAALNGLNKLIKKAPQFAEAYNQRAIWYYKLGDLDKAVADCKKVLELNPHHFGAQSGMAQSYLRQRKPREALKAYRAAYAINPNLDGVEESIRALENALGDEGKK
ncbi:MAG TPA: tetratricopeptide repeat protein [Gemmataceae bacterium]|nr:tetratricopeptide repeat protein [Gemmataceae bacterium]